MTPGGQHALALGIDLSSARWEWNGSALLELEAGRCIRAEVPALAWPDTELEPRALAAAIDAFARPAGVGAVAIDGPQGWRDPHAGPEQGVGRACERSARTPGKTGRNETYPSTYLGWTRFSIAVYDELLRLPGVVLAGETATPAPAGGYVVAECFPTSGWRACRLAPLPGKSRRPPVDEFARRLADQAQLPPTAVTEAHDDLQGVMAALAAAAALGAVAGRAHGRPARMVDGVRVEGTIWDPVVEGGRPPARQPLLVVVTGPPGAGKSTLARALADELSLPLVAKDDFKESLFETLGARSVEESRRLGIAAWELLFQVAGELLRGGLGVVVEGNFSDAAPFERLPPARVVQLHLSAPPHVLLDRYRSRARHPGHQTEAYAPEIRRRIDAGEWGSLPLRGRLIRVDTDGPVDVQDLARQTSP